MKKLFQFLVLAFLWNAVGRAQNDTSPTPTTENRFLFVIDTSSAMRPYSNIVEQAMVELLNSDLKGELRKGDTIGLWTYNAKLYTDFPMQVWSGSNKNSIVSQIADFLREPLYEKRAHLEKVLPGLQEVIKNSQRVTVFLIYDGKEMISGTPFDKDINDLQKHYAHELHAAHLPFITVLAARNGAVFNYTINYPGLVDIPHTAEPEPPPPPVTNEPPVVAVAPKPQRKIEIVMAGPSKAPQPAPAPVVPVPTPVAPVEPVKPIVTNAPAAPVAAIAIPVPPPEPVITNRPAPVAAPERPAPAPVVSIPAAPPAAAPARGTQLALYIMAFSLLTIAVVLVVFLVRRLRGGPQPSLISQSVDRTK